MAAVTDDMLEQTYPPKAEQVATPPNVVDNEKFIRFMHNNRKYAGVKGPYNPTLTDKEMVRFLGIQFRLQHGELPEGVAPIHDDYVSNFRRMYGFDIPSQVDFLEYHYSGLGEEIREGGRRPWNEGDLVLGTRIQDMIILASGELPKGYFYLMHQLNIVGETSRLRHYVVASEDEQTEFKVSGEDAGVLRDAIRTILARASENYSDVWRGELEWQNAEPMLRRLLNHTLLPEAARRPPQAWQK